MPSERNKRVLGKMDETYEGGGAPAGINPVTGQHHGHWVLSDDERKKGFVRPVRLSYRHDGIRPTHPTRELTTEEKERYASCGYVVYEAYPESDSSLTGRFWTKKQLESGCGTVTTMPLAIAETYAAQPDFYGQTFCCTCRCYLPLEEFRWLDDNSTVGS